MGLIHKRLHVGTGKSLRPDRFEVGDMVRVKFDGDHYTVSWVDDMDVFDGMVTEVLKVWQESDHGVEPFYCYRLEHEGRQWSFHHNWLEFA
jgi:hypothetical protein